MSVKTIILILGAGITGVILVFFLSGSFEQKQAGNEVDDHYIMDDNFRGDTAHCLLPEGAQLPDDTPADDALAFFQAMGSRFAEESLADLDHHFGKVKEYFHSVFSPSDAQRLSGLYQKYLNTEITIANDGKFKATSAAPREILTLLRKIQEYRRQQLGKENADALFGKEVKNREYFLRQALILDDPRLYGQDKAARMRSLQQAMWGAETPPAAQTGTDYDRYQLKLKMYRKDLSEMSEAQRNLRIDAFRREFFSQEAIERLAAADRQINAEKEKIEQYRQYEQQIVHDPAIDPAEKSKRLKTLQDELFGDEADAFRRREAIYGDAAGQEHQP